MKSMIRLLSILTVAAAALTAWATAPVHVSTDKHGLALRGHDPVAYFTDGGPAKGRSDLTLAHDGATYHFATVANRDAFEAEPEKYAPVYGGFCAYGMTLGKKFDTDPEAWKIVDGKLYLNKNQSVRKTWVKDVPGNIVKADERWPSVRDVPAAKL